MWWERFFDSGDYLRAFGPQLDADRTAGEVEGIVELAGLVAGDRVLDLACGQGRHAVALAALGLDVTAVDRSVPLLAQARAAAAAAGVAIRLVRADLRSPGVPDASFDAALLLFASFGYFADEADDVAVLAAAARALTPDGVLLHEVVNRDALVRAWQPTAVLHHDDELLVVEEQELDLRRGRHQVTYTLVEPDGVRRTHVTSVRLYGLPELDRLYDRAGLELETAVASLDGGEPSIDDPLLVLRGRRRQPGWNT